jgi:hypothetical protein
MPGCGTARCGRADGECLAPFVVAAMGVIGECLPPGEGRRFGTLSTLISTRRGRRPLCGSVAARRRRSSSFTSPMSSSNAPVSAFFCDGRYWPRSTVSGVS